MRDFRVENRDFETPADREITEEQWLEEATTRERLQKIATEYNIDMSDAFGKMLVLQTILSDMEEEAADAFMLETLIMLEDEIVNTLKNM